MRVKKAKSRIVFEIINYAILTILALICIFPFMHLLAISFSADEFTSKGEVSLIPMGFTVQAYEYLAQKPEFFTALGVSVLRTISGTALSLVVILMTAYPLSKTDGKFKGRTGFTWFFLITMFFGGGLFATYFLYKQLGLLNNFLIYILPGACDVWFVLMLMNFFRGIPKEIEDAAMMDGAGQFTVFLKVILPLIRNTVSLVLLIRFIEFWNDYQAPLLYIPSYPTLAYGIYDLNTRFDESSTTSIRMAGSIMFAAPIIVLFVIFKDKIMGNITMGGVKE